MPIKPLEQKIESDFFKAAPTSSVIRKREEHIKKTLEWANKDLVFNSSQVIEDSIMIDD